MRRPRATSGRVGVMLWEALASGHPFWGVPIGQMTAAIQAGPPPLREHRPDLPERLVAAVERSLHLNPAKRPPAAKLAAELRAALRDRRARRAGGRRVTASSPPSASCRPSASPQPASPRSWPPPARRSCPSTRPASSRAGRARGATSLAAPRLGLAVALFAPVFPLGNLARGPRSRTPPWPRSGSAVGWRDARAGLAFAAGPLLAPFGLLALVPLAVQPARGASGAGVPRGAGGRAPPRSPPAYAARPCPSEPDRRAISAWPGPRAPARSCRPSMQTLADRPELVVGAARARDRSRCAPVRRRRAAAGGSPGSARPPLSRRCCSAHRHRRRSRRRRGVATLLSLRRTGRETGSGASTQTRTG